MSADIFFITDEDNNDFSLEMNVHCAYIFVYSCDDKWANFRLNPNDKGINDAETIIAGLQSWIERVKNKG